MRTCHTRWMPASLTVVALAILSPVPLTAADGAGGPSLDKAPDELDTHVVKILRTTNKAQINRYVGKVYDFTKVNPGQINNYFHSALLREEGAGYTFVGEDGKSGKIFVICPEYQIPYYDQLALDLDRPDLTSAPGSAYLYRQLRHRSAADPQFLDILRQYATNKAVVLGDIETNAIFVFDSPAGGEYAIRHLEEYLDSPTPVVNTKVTLYEVQLNNDGTFGLDYEDYKNGPYQFMFSGSTTYNRFDGGTNNNGTSGSYSRQSKTSSSVIDLQIPSAYFDMLVDKGKARVVTDTQLVASSGTAASLFTGEQVLYYSKNDNVDSYSRTVTGSTAPRAIPTEVPPDRHNAAGVVVQAIDAGIELSLVPTIGRDAIALEINTAVVSLLGFTESGDPILNSRRANTTLTIPDGEQVVLGGLVRERQGRTSYKMPVLGSLPVIGWLFGGETEVLQKSMLVIVVQPTIDKSFNTVASADQTVIDQATGAAGPDIPKAAWGFDQFLLDNE